MLKLQTGGMGAGVRLITVQDNTMLKQKLY